MTTFTKYNAENAPQGSAEILTKTTKKIGFTPNILGYMAESPVLLKSYTTLSAIFSSSSLDVTEQQVILMTINRFHECRYCMAAHTTTAALSGVDMDAISSIRDDESIGDKRLGALRGFTLSLVEQRGRVSKPQLTALLSEGYTKETVMEIIAAVAYKTMSNYANHIVDSEVDELMLDSKWVPIIER